MNITVIGSGYVGLVSGRAFLNLFLMSLVLIKTSQKLTA